MGTEQFVLGCLRGPHKEGRAFGGWLRATRTGRPRHAKKAARRILTQVCLGLTGFVAQVFCTPDPALQFRPTIVFRVLPSCAEDFS